MQLPYIQATEDLVGKTLNLLQTKYRAILNPLIALPILNGNQLLAQPLVIGSNVINHRLGRMQQGYLITDLTGPATVYRSASFNDKTLTLTSNANCNISLWCF